jgi:putative transposase
MYEENFRVYGAEKVWRQLKREHWIVAGCTAERLMTRLGLQVLCVVAVSTAQRSRIPRRPARAIGSTASSRQSVPTSYGWPWSGLVFVSLSLTYSLHRIVGWRVARSLKTELVLESLEQALWARGDTS